MGPVDQRVDPLDVYGITRWDRAHLHEFHFPDPNGPASGYERIAVPDPDWDELGEAEVAA